MRGKKSMSWFWSQNKKKYDLKSRDTSFGFITSDSLNLNYGIALKYLCDNLVVTLPKCGYL